MSCKILYSAVLKFKPLKFSLYESRLSRILTKHHSRTTTASSQLELPGTRPCSSPCPAEGHPRPSGGREEDKDVAFRVITCAMSSLQCLLCSGKANGVLQSRWEVLWAQPVCTNTSSELTPAPNSPTLPGSAQEPGHSPSAPH